MTAIVVDRVVVPPPPVHASVKVLVVLSGAVGALPAGGFVPPHAPDASQLVALVDDQVRVADVPALIVAGVALIVTVGGGGVTVTTAVCAAVPPGPVQVRE